MKYCLDANMFIEPPKKFYTFDIAPPYWNALVEWGNQGVICSTRRVLSELDERDDELSTWAKSVAKGLFHLPDDNTYGCYSDIADFVEANYEPQHKQEFLNGADPWVIAHAKAHELTVATFETLKIENKNSNTGLIQGKIKIPNVCKAFEVEFADIKTMLRDLKFKFQ